MSTAHKEMLQKTVQRLKDDSSSSQKFLTNLSDEELRDTALFQNFQTSTEETKHCVDYLTLIFDLEIK